MFLGTKTMSLSSVCVMTGIHFMKLRLGSFVMVCIVRAMRWLILVIALMSRILCRLSTYCINTLYSPIISQPPSCTSDQATFPKNPTHDSSFLCTIKCRFKWNLKINALSICCKKRFINFMPNKMHVLIKNSKILL